MASAGVSVQVSQCRFKQLPDWRRCAWCRGAGCSPLEVSSSGGRCSGRVPRNPPADTHTPQTSPTFQDTSPSAQIAPTTYITSNRKHKLYFRGKPVVVFKLHQSKLLCSTHCNTVPYLSLYREVALQKYTKTHPNTLKHTQVHCNTPKYTL